MCNTIPCSYHTLTCEKEFEHKIISQELEKKKICILKQVLAETERGDQKVGAHRNSLDLFHSNHSA